MTEASRSAVTIRVSPEPFDEGVEIRHLVAGRADIGGVVAFTGFCRDEGGTLAALELEHYPGMAERAMAGVAEGALRRWPLLGLTIIHRFGLIRPGEAIVLVAAAASHRRAAFEAADFLMDYLKSRAPFWKKEHRADGTTGDWVAAKTQDEDDLRRWEAAGGASAHGRRSAPVNGPKLAGGIPVLRIFDVEKAKAFYLDFLGFRLDWEHRYAPDLPLYAQVSRDALKLHLSEHHGDGTPGTVVHVGVRDAPALFRELAARNTRHSRPSEHAASADIIDPFGNVLRFDGGRRE